MWCSRKSYQLGDIGAHARVAIGENIAWSEGLSRYPGGDEPTGQLSALERIASDPELGEPERTLATARTEAVAPPCLARRRSLSDSRRRCWTPRSS